MVSTDAVASKNFFFTITASNGLAFDLTSVSSLVRSTASGPSDMALVIGSNVVNSVATPNSETPILSVSGTNLTSYTGLTNLTVRIVGYSGGSRTSTGNGVARIGQIAGSLIVRGSGPSIQAAPALLGGLTATQGTPGVGTNFFTASGSNLSNNITVVANDATNFAIATNVSGPFANTLTLFTNSSGAVPNTSIYVRLTGTKVGDFTNSVSLSSLGAATTNVMVSGTVSPPPTPTVQAAPTNVAGLQSFQGSPSVAPYGSYALSGAAITNSVTVSAPAGLQVSFTNDGNGFASSHVIPAAPPGGTFSTNVFVRIASGAGLGAFTNFITNSTVGGTSNSIVEVSGEVLPAGAAIITPPNGTTLSGFTSTRPAPSTNQQISVSGTNLPGSITITPPPGWEISATNSNNPTANSIVLATNPAGVVSTTPLFIRMASSPVATNYTNSTLRLVSGTNTNSITLLGTVNNPPPQITLSNSTLTNFSTPLGTASVFQSFFAGGTNLTSNITVTAPANFALSFANSAPATNTQLTITNTGDVAAPREIFVQLTGATAGTFSTNISLTSGTAATNVPVSGTVVPPPGITLTMPSTMRQGDAGSGTVALNSAPPNDVVVALSCSSPNLLALPATVTVPAGTNSVEFNFETFGGAPSTTVTTLALATGYTEGRFTTILTPDPSAASFGIGGYQQSFADFLSQVTLPAGWTVSSAGTNADVFTAWASTTSGSKFSVPGTNVFGFQHVEATGTARQVLTLRNDTGVALTNLVVRYNGRVARADQPRAPVYTVEVAGTVMTNLAYSTLSSDNLLRVATNRNVQIAPGQIFQISWSSDRGTNAGGSARQIGISAVNLSSSVTPVSSITASPTNITGFATIAGSVSSPQAAFVSGTNLPTNITVTPPLGFEVSTNFAGGFSTNTFSLPASAGGLPVTPLYVRVAADASPGVLSGVLALGSASGTNAVSAQVALSGLVFSNTPGAQLLVDQSSLTNFSTAFPSNSTSQSFQVAATGFSTNSLTVLASSNFAVSIDNVNFTNSVSLAPVGGAIGPRPVYVALRGLQIGANTGTVSLSASNIATQIINLSGQVDPPPPVITVDIGGMPTNTPQFSTPQGRPSSFGFFTTSASNLTTNVTVAAPQNYEISLSQTTNYSRSVILSNTSGSIVSRPVFVRLTGEQLMPLRTNEISLSSGTAATNVTVTGQVTNAPPPDIGLLGTSLTNFVTVQGVPSPAQPFQASASNVLSPVTVEAPPDYEVSLVAGSGFGRAVQISPINYSVRPTTLYLRLSDSAVVGENISGVVRASSPAVDGSIVFGNDLPVSGTVTTNNAPFIVALPKSLVGFGAIAGGVSTNQVLSVGGTNLNDFLTISTTNAYQLSTTGVSNTFTNTLRLVPFTPGAIAQDRGLNYYNGTNVVTPTTGMGRGNGFGNWTITTSTVSGGSAGIFVGSPTNAGIVGMGPDSFGLFANPASASNRVVARRDFNQPLQTNEVFSFQWGNNFDAGSSGSKGMRLLQGTNAMLTIAMGGNANLTVRNGTNAPVNMFTNYGTNAIDVFIERASANLLTVRVPFGRDGGAGYTNTFPNTNTPTGFEFFAQALQGGPPNENRDRAQPYFNNLVVTTNGGVTSANVGPTNVFVRMVAASNSPVGPQNGTLALVSAGATNKSVGLTGAVYGAPVLTVAPTNLTGFITTGGVASTNQRFDLVANALETDVALSVGGGFEVSLAADAGYTSNLVISNAAAGAGSLTNFPIFVRLGTNGVTGPAVSTVQITASGFAGQTVSNSVAVSGTVFQSGSNAQIGEPQPASLTGFRTTLGQASQPRAYVFNAVNLGNRPVLASVSTGYEISLREDGGWTTVVSNAPSGGIIAGVTNYVRVAAAQPGTNNNLAGTVTLSSAAPGASNQTVNLRGQVLPEPGVSVNPASITNLWTVQGFQSAPSTFQLTASNLQGPVTVTAASPLLLSVGGGAYSSSVSIPNSAQSNASAVVSVVVGASNANLGTFTNSRGITFSTPGATSGGSGLNVVNGNFTNLSGLTLNTISAQWLDGLPAGWSTANSTSASTPPFSVFTNGGVSIANLQALGSTAGGFNPLYQTIGSLSSSGSVTVSFQLFNDWQPANSFNVGAAIYNWTTPGLLTPLANATYTNIGLQSLQLGSVGAGVPLAIAFWSTSGAPGLDNVSISSSGSGPSLSLSPMTTVHTVAPRPSVTVNPTQLTNFWTVVSNSSTPPVPFTVSGSNLLTDIALVISNTGAADKYEMSTNAASGWTNRITLVPDYSGTNSSGPPVTVAEDNAENYGVQTYNAFDDFYVNVPATGGNGNYTRATWIANTGTVPFDTGLTNANTWGYAGGNFNGVGAPSSVGTYVTGGNFYSLTLGGTFSGPGASYDLGGGNFWIGYNDQYGAATPGQTQIGKYTKEWFAGSPNYKGNTNGTNNKFLWLQGTGLGSATDGLGALLTWTAPKSGTFQFSGSYVNGNYGPSTSFAIVDSLNTPLLAKQTLAPSSSTNSFNFSRTYSAGDVVQFQAGTPVAAQGSPLGLSVAVSLSQPAWQTGANGGTGFGPWTITSGTAANGSAGAFVGNPTNAGIGGMSTNSFGLYANPANNANFVIASRQFAAPLAVGESFSFEWGNNYDAGSGSKGVNLTDPAGSNVFNLNMGGSAAITLVQGTNPPVTVQPATAYGTNAMTFTFTRTASNTFTVSAPAGRNLGPGFTNVFSVTNQVSGFAFYASGLQAGTPVDRDSAQPYFNNLLVTAPGSGSSGGVVSNTAIYVRLRSDAPVGRAQQKIDLTSGPYAELKSVSLDGDVLPKPVYSITPSALTNLSTVTNTPSVPGVLLVNAANLVSNLVVGVPGSVPNAFQISTNASSGFTNLLTIPPGTGTLANLPLYVRIASWPTVQFVSNSLTFSNRFAATEVTNVPVAGQVLQANPGDPRPGFNPPSAGSSLAGPPVSTVASATNGSFYIGGNFTSLVRSNNGTTNTNSAIRVARILADGAVDTGFDAGAGPNAEVRALLYSAADAGLYIGGQFTSVAGVARTGLARLAVSKTGLADGALDPAFVPVFTGVQPPVVNEIVQQYDGKILVAGTFATVGGVASANLARLLTNGEVDPSFIPPQPRGVVNAIALQPDGKILIAGSFAEVGGLPRRGLARLNRDGSVDPTFSVGSGADGGFNGTVFSVAVGLDNSIYAGGQFSSYNGQSVYNNLVKLSPTGELRSEFNFAANLSSGINGPVRSLIVRPTGALFMSGNFSQIANSVLFPTPVAVGRVAQMLPDGTVDMAFNPGSPGANNAVLDAATLANGDLVVVGSFTEYDGLARSGMAVLAGFNGLTPVITSPSFYTVNAGQPVSFAFTGTGPAPVTFSLAGGSATNPPPAVLPEGVTFSLPGSFAGYPMKSGAYNMFVSSRPASGEPSAPTPFTFYVVPSPVPYESWAKAWFGSQWNNPAVAAPGVSAGNPSGLNNLAVYALDGGNPYTLGPGIAPFARPVTDTNGATFLNYSVNRNPLAMASYNVFYSTNLLRPWLSGTNSLRTLIDTPELLEVRPLVPMSLESRQFLRLQMNLMTNQTP